MSNQPITKETLINTFQTAKEQDIRYVGVLIEMEGFPKPELIINRKENFDAKLEYYLNTYDENLVHKFAKKIRIIGVTSQDWISEIEADFDFDIDEE